MALRNPRSANQGSPGGYESAEDRDRAVESYYRLSEPILALLGGERPVSVLAAVSAEQVALAEMFHQEHPRGATLDERADYWCVGHFGRKLEPAARGILLFALRRTLALGQGGRVAPPGSIFRDFVEQRAWERATVADHEPGSVTDRARRIALSVTGEIADGPPTMPRRRKGGVSL